MAIRFGVQIRSGSLSSIIYQSILCEKVGFDSIWYPDHLIGGHPKTVWHELYTIMTTMGTNTSRIIIGSAATDALRRHPAVIAQSFATIDQLTGGRTALGIGAGEAMNLQPFGIPMKKPYTKLREAIEIIKLLWTNDYTEPIEFRGKFYRLKKAYQAVKPIQKPHPPIYVGAFGNKMLKMTGKLANGWIPFSHTPETYRDSLNVIQRAGPRKRFEPAFLPVTSISKDREQARNEVVRTAQRFLVLLPTILQQIAPKVTYPEPVNLTSWMGHLDEKQMKIISEIAKQIPPDLALQTVIWGTPDDCIGQIEKFIKAGCRHFIFGILSRDLYEAIQLLGSIVLPFFRGA